MHLNFAFTTIQILWTITFASLLVLLVVLLGRDRVSRFPLFTGSIVVTALSLLTARLLYGRLPQLTMAGISIVLTDLSAILSFLVLVEMARRAFGRASRTASIAGTAALLAVGAVVLAEWGPWPSFKTLRPDTPIAALGLLQLLAEKLGLLDGVLAVGLALLVVLLGNRFGAGRRSHVQQIVVGLSVASLAQMGVQFIWQLIARHTTPHSLEEYHRVMGMKDKLINANSTVYIVVVMWWILCLWVDEPGTAPATAEAAGTTLPADTRA
jgi:hypothetical protein